MWILLSLLTAAAPAPEAGAVTATLAPPTWPEPISAFGIVRLDRTLCPDWRLLPADARCVGLGRGVGAVHLAVIGSLQGDRIGTDSDRSGRVDRSEWAPVSQAWTEVTWTLPARGEPVRVQARVALSEARDRLFIAWPDRAGTVDLPGGPVGLLLHGHARGHGGAPGRVTLDVDRDGILDTRGLEAVPVGRTVVVDGRAWRVDAPLGGDRVTLTPVDPPADLLAKGHPVPAFSLADVDGTDRSPAQARGSWLVLTFWGTWCGPCVADHPNLRDLVASRDDVVALGVARDSRDQVRRYRRQHPHPWPDIVVDRDHDVLRTYGVSGYPTYVLVDPEGRVALRGRLDQVRQILGAPAWTGL